MDSPHYSHPLEQLSLAQPSQRRHHASPPPRDMTLSPDRIVVLATVIGAVLALALVTLLLR